MLAEPKYTLTPLSEEDSVWWEFDVEVLIELAGEYRDEEWKEWLDREDG